jgi:hypothetical protein
MSTQTEPVVNVESYVDQRGSIDYLKRDAAEMVLKAGYENGRLQEKEITEGIKLMAKMLVKEKGGKLEPRPAGFAIGFTREPRDGETASQLLYREGHIVLTGAVEIDGESQYVGIDKQGPFLIKGDLLPVFDQIGDQEENMWIKTSNKPNLREGAPLGLIITPLKENSEGVEIVTKAMVESMQSPFISTADYQKAVPKAESPQVEQPIASFASIDI